MTLTAAQFAEAARLAQNSPYLWLLEIEVPTDPVSRYRLNNSAHAFPFGTDGDGVALVYEPFPFEVGSIDIDGQGRQYNFAVTVSNITRELQAAIEAYDGMIGQPVSLRLVHKALAASGDVFLELEGDIVTHRATAKDIAFEIGQENLYSATFPGLRTDHDYCSHPYGGVLCGYDTTRSGALQSCSFLVDGPNGCREHGDDEEDAGEERRHPRRWGGCKGTPRRQGVSL